MDKHLGSCITLALKLPGKLHVQAIQTAFAGVQAELVAVCVNRIDSHLHLDAGVCALAIAKALHGLV